MIPSKGVTWLMSVSPAEATSAVDSGLSVGTKVSLRSGSFIDEGASTLALISIFQLFNDSIFIFMPEEETAKQKLSGDT